MFKRLAQSLRAYPGTTWAMLALIALSLLLWGRLLLKEVPQTATAEPASSQAVAVQAPPAAMAKPLQAGPEPLQADNKKLDHPEKVAPVFGR